MADELIVVTIEMMSIKNLFIPFESNDQDHYSLLLLCPVWHWLWPQFAQHIAPVYLKV